MPRLVKGELIRKVNRLRHIQGHLEQSRSPCLKTLLALVENKF